MITAKLTKENAAKLIGTRCAMKSNLHSFLGYAGVYWTEGGEFAISFDPDHKKWHHENLGCTVMYYYGCCHQYQIFNNYKLLRK